MHTILKTCPINYSNIAEFYYPKAEKDCTRKGKNTIDPVHYGIADVYEHLVFTRCDNEPFTKM